jgi:glycosyltransferase involved in cell wall biosynthesis
MINITYAITVCNELEEITKLVDFLKDRIKKDDEILIQYDETSVTDAIKGYLTILSQLHTNTIKVIGYPLNNDFASFKNNIKDNASGIFIFQIDADEVPSEYLVENLSEFIEFNKDVDLFFVPRINTVAGLTPKHVKKWNWNISQNGWVNFPDYQTRIYRRTSEIEWVGKVHERIIGYNTLSVLPAEEQYCLYHHKQIERQEKQNAYYDTI